MKSLDHGSNVTADECAELVLDTVPLVSRTIRTEMRRSGPPDLSVPQFRVLTFLRRHPGTSLSEVAEHIGLTLPAASNLIDRLVNRNLVDRQNTSTDRRRIALALTISGESTMQAASIAALAHLTEVLNTLSAEERAVIAQAMVSLKAAFESDQPPDIHSESTADHV
jgi:DNA-binding MarR family transcriptional regulator